VLFWGCKEQEGNPVHSPSRNWQGSGIKGTQPPKGSWQNRSEWKYLHVLKFCSDVLYHVGKDLRYWLQFLIQPCTICGHSLTEGGKLSKPGNSANHTSLRLLWVETWKITTIRQSTTSIYNLSKFQAKSQNTDVGWGTAILGSRSLRKHAQTPCGHPSTHHISIE